MDIEFKGGNCIAIQYKKDEIVIDPKLSAIGYKDQGAHARAQVLTQSGQHAPHDERALIIDGPGEYEVHNCTIKGIAAQRFSAADDAPLEATMYRIEADDISVAVIGHANPKLSDDQLEALGVVDVLVVPVGGYGYTLDAKAAVELTRKIEPKIVVPTHFADSSAKYEVPQASVDEFLKEIGGAQETTAKLKLKSGQLPAALTVFQLTITK